MLVLATRTQPRMQITEQLGIRTGQQQRAAGPQGPAPAAPVRKWVYSRGLGSTA
jgi:hypothetical protein